MAQLPKPKPASAPLGTIRYKRFDHNPEAFDVFVMTRKGWVLVDQSGAQSRAEPHGWGYTELQILPAKVSEAG